MKLNFARVITYLQTFMLGGYFVSQFQFNKPIELHRWLLTSFFLILFLTITNRENKD